MGWTHHFFHPARSAREADELRQENERLEAELASVRVQLDTKKAELADLQEKSIAETEETRLAMAQIEELMDGVDEAKSRYLKRIADLKAKISEMREEMRRLTVSREYNVIDMTPRSPEPEPPRHRKSEVQTTIPFDEEPPKTASQEPPRDFTLDDTDWLKMPE